MGRTLKKDRYWESVQAAFLMLPSYRRFPTDEEFQSKVKVRDLYNFRSRSYWLRRLENYGRKERVVVEDYTIEHILPQNAKLSEAWQAELGGDWKRIHQTWLHTLGNLTLTGYNSEYSDFPFAYKRDQVEGKDGKKIGFKFSGAPGDRAGFSVLSILTKVLARLASGTRVPFKSAQIA